MDQYVSATEAAALLEVRRETLYAYVSRGRVRTVAGPDGRTRRYHRDDLERLRARSRARAGHAAVAAGALAWGEPVLDTAITEIRSDGPHYRGTPAVDLARRATYEAVADRLWTPTDDTEPGSVSLWARSRVGVDVRRLRGLLPDVVRPVDVLALAVPVLAARDEMRFEGSAEAMVRAGRAVIPRLAALVALARVGGERGPDPVERAYRRTSVAGVVAHALGARAARAEDARRAVEVALVLCADHELNASTFAARVAAGAGADVYACIAAALATMSGPRHGGAVDRCEAFVAEAARARDPAAAVGERMRRGEGVPGFGHPLYPDGDPRYPPLVALARRLAPRDPDVRAVLAIARAMVRIRGERPTLDLGLVALAAALRLPAGGGHALFAIGRLAGWIAHAAEQRASGRMLRPRARFVGGGG